MWHKPVLAPPALSFVSSCGRAVCQLVLLYLSGLRIRHRLLNQKSLKFFIIQGYIFKRFVDKNIVNVDSYRIYVDRSLVSVDRLP